MAAEGGATTELLLTARRSELGETLAREHARAAPAGRGRTLINLALQRSNSLLHDGHRWGTDPAAYILSSTRRAVAEAARRRAGFVVHASYAFLGDAQLGGRVGDRLRRVVEAALEAEAMVLDAGRPGCVVRIGYLYGPESADLRAYRRAFLLRRPYWAGPPANLQHHVHTTDAARALLLAAAARPATAITYATDDVPASFATVMDHFAHLVGRRHPRHVPPVVAPLMGLVVRDYHRQMTDLAASGQAMPRLPGFTPLYRDHRAGLAQVIEAWQSSR